MAEVEPEQLRLFHTGVDMRAIREARERLATNKRSRRTQIDYAGDVRIFSAWCEHAGRKPLPASSDTLALFVTSQLEGGKRIATAERRMRAILSWHRTQNAPTPDHHLSLEVLRGARRERKEKPGGKKALRAAELKEICASLGSSNAEVRDRALMVIGWATGARRSELARLDLDDIGFEERGVVVTIWYGKADQEGKGRHRGLRPGKRASTCPVRTLKAWLTRRGKEPGPLFTRVQTGDFVTKNRMTGEAINEIVQRAVERIGLDPRLYGAHSLRAGVCTEASARGASDRQIMQITGHKSVAVMQKYIRHTGAFLQHDPVAAAL